MVCQVLRWVKTRIYANISVRQVIRMSEGISDEFDCQKKRTTGIFLTIIYPELAYIYGYMVEKFILKNQK